MSFVGVDGQYVCDVTIGGVSVFDGGHPDTLRNLVLRQRCAGVMPVLKMEFLVRDDLDVGRFNEGNALVVRFGAFRDAVLSGGFYIVKSSVSDFGADERLVKLECVLDKPDYAVATRLGVSGGRKSAIDVLRGVLGRSFGVFDTNIEVSGDVQVWWRPSMPDRQFVAEVLGRMNLVGSFPLMSVLALNDECRVMDMVKLFRDPSWVLESVASRGGDGGRDDRRRIPILPGSVFDVDSGALNQLYGYRSRLRQVVWGSGEYVDFEDGTVPRLSAVEDWNRHSISGGSRLGVYKVLTGNHHAKYHEVKLTNVAQAARYSSFKGVVSFNDRYRNVKPLDVVELKESGIAGGVSSEGLSGAWIVSGVSHRVRGDQYSATLYLNREAVGGSRGSFG